MDKKIPNQVRTTLNSSLGFYLGLIPWLQIDSHKKYTDCIDVVVLLVGADIGDSIHRAHPGIRMTFSDTSVGKLPLLPVTRDK